MISSNYDIAAKKRFINPALACALSLATTSFAENSYKKTSSNSELEIPTSSEVASKHSDSILERPSPHQDFVITKDVHEMVNRWSVATQLYVSGNIGLNQDQLKKLSTDLKDHPNWTVYLIASCKGTQYSDSDGNSYANNEAVEHALGKEIRKKSEFIELKDPSSGLSSGNILYISFDKESAYRKVGYIAGEAYDVKGLGEANWAGNLDQLAIRPLKDGRRVHDAVIGSISQIDARLAGKQIVSEQQDLDPTVFNIILFSLAAVAAGSFLTGRLSRQFQEVKNLKDALKEKSQVLSQYSNSHQLLEREIASLTKEGTIGAKATGTTLAFLSRLQEKNSKLRDYFGNANDTANSIVNECKNLSLFSSDTKIESVIKWVNGSHDGTLNTYIKNIRKSYDEVFSDYEKLEGCLNGKLIEALKTDIQKEFVLLQNLQKQERLGAEFSESVDSALKSWATLSASKRENDPVSLYDELSSIKDRLLAISKDAASKQKQYETLISDLDKAEKTLAKITDRIKILEEKGKDPAELKKLVESHQDQAQQLKIAKTEVSDNSSQWLSGYVAYSALINTINASAHSAGVAANTAHHTPSPSSSHGGGSSSYGGSSYGSSGGCSSGFSGGGSGCSSSGW